MDPYNRIYEPLTNRFIFEKERSLESPAVADVTDQWPAQNSMHVHHYHDHRLVPEINQPQKAGSSQAPVMVESPSKLIARPKGSLSKPGAGGYSLRDALGWSKDHYKTIQAQLQKLCDRYLDTRISFREQDQNAMNGYRTAAARMHPMLQQYDHAWPVDDFAAIYLKNTSASFRRRNRSSKGHDKVTRV
ncbi:hypothetical protein F5887DRAFT_1072488 [Amanita rubescens]|nr:hypothetical protein F5887DRAFT_1072488 [Amanita rubescens]